jgi:hypothetical protein
VLTIGGNITNSGSGDLDNYGCIHGGGTLTVSAAGTNLINGTTTNSTAGITTNGTITISGGGGLTNYGTIYATGASSGLSIGAGNLANKSTGNLVIGGDVSVTGNVTNAGCFNVNGTGTAFTINGGGSLTNSAGAFLTIYGNYSAAVPFTNNSCINIDNGSFTAGTAITTCTNAAGQAIYVASNTWSVAGTFTQGAGSCIGSGCTPCGAACNSLAPASACASPVSSSCNTLLMPVELLYFKGSCRGKDVKLNWATASEQNNAYFTIERSKDAIHFEPIGTVNGAGNSSVNLTYEFVDQLRFEEGQGMRYYRLIQNDYNGQNNYYGPTAVTCGPSDIVIYPNVSSGLFFIAGMSGNAQVIVYSMLGEKVFSLLRQQPAVDLSALSNGIYFIQVATEQKSFTQKIIIQK